MGGSDYLLEPLTQRELEILRLLAEGLSDREIAQRLVIAQGTVKWYNKQLYSKLGVHSRSQAVDRGRELGLLDDVAAALLSGTVTFLFTDIEGSTKLWQRHPEAMGAALQQHDALLRRVIQENDGRVFKTVGDAFCAVFDDAAKALSAAHCAQTAISAQDWGKTPIRIRMALHTGTAELRDDDYFGPAVNHVARLLSAGHAGQILLSAATRALAQSRLPDELSLRDLGEHRLKDLERAERIYQLIAPDLPADFPALNSLDAYPNNLPVQLTSFVGRQREINAVKQLLTANRLLTLSGPPGTGKTRLGLRVVTELLNQFADGVYFVELAPISDPALVATTIAQLFGVRETAGQPLLKTLQIYLREKRLLLLIDNFEQVIDAAPLVGELLSAAPGVKALVTSREALRIYGEQEYAVPPLTLPDPERIEPLRALGQYEAVDLFCHRAGAVKPDFTLTEKNAPAVAEICVRLDGLPLAIELVAVRSKLLSPESMCARLESRLLTSTGGARDLPARQQTLRAAVDWSYDLLDPVEKILFARLAVFQGGRSVEAVETVCGHGLAIDILEGLESLLNKSLLGQDVGLDGEPRFIMLEMLHEYARERLEEGGEAGDIQRRHVEDFLDLAECAAPEMRRAGYVYWSLRLRDEHNNLRTALSWSLGEGETELGLKLAGALRDFWCYGGHSAEGLAWTQRALESATDAPPAVQARALNAAGRLSWEQGDHTNGKLYNGEALALFRELGDEVNAAWALAFLSSQFQALPGGLKEATTLCEEGLALFRRLDDRPGIIFAANVLGELARLDGDYERAGRAHEESLAIAREEGDKLRQALPLHNLGYVAQHAGDYEWAETAMLEGIVLLLELENTRFIPQDLATLAGPIAGQGNAAKAVRLLGASEALLEKMGLVPQAGDQVEIERNVAFTREQLDEAAFEAAWSQGRAMSFEEAVAYALGNEVSIDR
jgi:predicted ATPase/class 3 adenylate cyclase